MTEMSKMQQAIDAIPPQLNWVVIVGSLALSILQPLAALAALILACLQIYFVCKKHWFSGSRDRRKKERS